MDLHITNLTSHTAMELRGFAAMLTTYAAHIEGAVEQKVEAVSEKVVAEIKQEAAAVEQIVEKKLRRTRKDVAQDKAAAEPSQESAPIIPAPEVKPEPWPFEEAKEAVEKVEAKVEQAVTHTLEDLRDALQRFSAEHGMPAACELLKKFGCARISEVADKNASVQSAFMAECPKKEG